MRNIGSLPPVDGCETGDADLSSLDWAWIIATARRHRILPFIVVQIEEMGLINHVDRSLLPSLGALVLQARASFERTNEEFLRIVPLLRERQLQIIPLKGLSLSWQVYAGRPYRQMDDIDILVRKGDLGRFLEVLKELGYSCSLYAIRNRWHKKIYFESSQRRSAFRGKNEIDFHVDPRYSLPKKAVASFDIKGFWSRTKPLSPSLPENILALSANDHLVYLLVHHLSNTYPSLLRVLDILCLLSTLRMHQQPVDIALSLSDAISPEVIQQLKDYLDRIEEIFCNDPANWSEEAQALFDSFFEFEVKQREREGSSYSPGLREAIFGTSIRPRDIPRFCLGYLLPDPEYYKELPLHRQFFIHLKSHFFDLIGKRENPKWNRE